MSKHLNKKFCCPACDRDIVNRAVDRCLYCGEPLPKELQFSREEIQENEETYKEKIRGIEESRKRKKRTEGGDYGGAIDFGDGDW